MKNSLIFINNDNEIESEKELSFVKQNLKYICGIDSEKLQNIQSICNFGSLKKEEVYDILFNEKNVILTWSMYTNSHFNSLTQMLTLLSAAGRNEVENIIYVDASGMLEAALRNNLKSFKNPLELLNAIETNNIISFDLNELTCYRLRVELKGYYKNPFKREPFNLKDLLL